MGVGGVSEEVSRKSYIVIVFLGGEGFFKKKREKKVKGEVRRDGGTFTVFGVYVCISRDE